MAGQILALCGNSVRQMLGVVPDAPDEARSPSRLPRQSQKIDSGLDRNAALMLRPTLLVEGVNLQPAIVGSKTCRPNDRSYSGLRQVQLEDWVGHALRIRFDLASIELLWKIEAIAGYISVSFVQQRHVAGIATRKIVRKISREDNRTVPVRFCPAKKRHPLRGQTPEVNRPAAASTAHGNRDMLRAGP